MTNPQQLVSKLWDYCNILRDDGLSYGDYMEQLTFLLFMKMAEEQAQLRKKPSAVPDEYGWQEKVSVYTLVHLCWRIGLVVAIDYLPGPKAEG